MRFKTIPEAKNWLDEAKYEDKHSDALLSSKTTVNEWFEFWLENLVSDLAPNTIRNYRERYTRDVRPVIGDLRLSDVKPMETAWSFKRSNDNGSVCSRFRGIYV